MVLAKTREDLLVYLSRMGDISCLSAEQALPGPAAGRIRFHHGPTHGNHRGPHKVRI
ncbi:MAG: hypothetical protein ACTSRA_20925 [Promethearchaeota archaeon]